MSTKHLKQSDFARKLGITRQAVYKALEQGQIKKHGTGHAAYIDLDCPMTKAYIESTSVNRHRDKTVKPQGKPKPAPPKKTKAKTPPDSPDNIEAVEAHQAKQHNKDLKIREELEKIRLHNRKTRGELIERDIVAMFINAMYEIDNGQWKTLGTKISSDVAAALDVEDNKSIRKVNAVIEKEVHAVLKRIKRDQNAFLKKIGAKKLPKEPPNASRTA